MCMSCGCGSPSDNHGDERNITQEDLDRAAQAASISREQAAENIMSCCQPQRADQGEQQQTTPGEDEFAQAVEDGGRVGQRPRAD